MLPSGCVLLYSIAFILVSCGASVSKNEKSIVSSPRKEEIFQLSLNLVAHSTNGFSSSDADNVTGIVNQTHIHNEIQQKPNEDIKQNKSENGLLQNSTDDKETIDDRLMPQTVYKMPAEGKTGEKNEPHPSSFQGLEHPYTPISENDKNILKTRRSFRKNYEPVQVDSGSTSGQSSFTSNAKSDLLSGRRNLIKLNKHRKRVHLKGHSEEKEKLMFNFDNLKRMGNTKELLNAMPDIISNMHKRLRFGLQKQIKDDVGIKNFSPVLPGSAILVQRPDPKNPSFIVLFKGENSDEDETPVVNNVPPLSSFDKDRLNWKEDVADLGKRLDVNDSEESNSKSTDISNEKILAKQYIPRPKVKYLKDEINESSTVSKLNDEESNESKEDSSGDEETESDEKDEKEDGNEDNDDDDDDDDDDDNDDDDDDGNKENEGSDSGDDDDKLSNENDKNPPEERSSEKVSKSYTDKRNANDRLNGRVSTEDNTDDEMDEKSIEERSSKSRTNINNAIHAVGEEILPRIAALESILQDSIINRNGHRTIPETTTDSSVANRNFDDFGKQFEVVKEFVNKLKPSKT